MGYGSLQDRTLKCCFHYFEYFDFFVLNIFLFCFMKFNLVKTSLFEFHIIVLQRTD